MTIDALRANFRGWISSAGLGEMLTLLDVLEDELIDRKSPAAALIAQAAAMLRRQMGR